jgi:hypothetical protein
LFPYPRCLLDSAFFYSLAPILHIKCSINSASAHFCLSKLSSNSSPSSSERSYSDPYPSSSSGDSYISVISHTICCLEASSFNVMRWIRLFVARSRKRLFRGDLTKPLTA